MVSREQSEDSWQHRWLKKTACSKISSSIKSRIMPAIKGISITVWGDIFLFLKRVRNVWEKGPKTLHPAEQVTLCVISLPTHEIQNAYQSLMRHQISGRRKMTCHFCRVPPSAEEQGLNIRNTLNLICEWTGHWMCEWHHLFVERSHTACEIRREEAKAKERKKEPSGKKKLQWSKKSRAKGRLLHITLNCGTC